MPVRKNWLGKYAAWLSRHQHCHLAGLAQHSLHHLSPAASRVAMEQRLRREMQKHLEASNDRVSPVCRRRFPDLSTAAVNLSGVQEMRGIEGKNVWVDIDGSIAAGMSAAEIGGSR